MRNTVPVLAMVCAFATAAPAHAQTLQVSPTTVELSPTTQATTIMVRNLGTAPAVAQIRIFAWGQKGTEDVLSPAADVVASPPAVRVAPGAEQIIRIVRPAPTPPPVEASYRLIVDEIPNTATVQGSTVILRMQHSIPVFVLPQRSGEPVLTWRLERDGDAVRLTATNAGGRRSKLVDFTMGRPGGGKVHTVPGLFGYVLARSSRSWVFKPDVTLEPGERLEIAVGLDRTLVKAVVALDAPG